MYLSLNRFFELLLCCKISKCLVFRMVKSYLFTVILLHQWTIVEIIEIFTQLSQLNQLVENELIRH